VIAALGTLIAGATVNASTITEYKSTSGFDAAIGVPLNVETFGTSTSYPITGGTVKSLSRVTPANGVPITPGMIRPAVTYSTPAGTGNYFNIDEGLYFSGGLLDRTNGGSNDNSNVALTTAFDQNVNGFGFLARPLMGTAMWVDIHRASGQDQAFSNLTIPNSGTSFFGFVSTTADITSATIYGNSTSRPSAIDRFTYPAEAVPEPSALLDAAWPCWEDCALWIRESRRRSVKRG